MNETGLILLLGSRDLKVLGFYEEAATATRWAPLQRYAATQIPQNDV